MERVLLTLCCVFLASVHGWDPGLRVRFGITNIGVDHFVDLPKSVSDATGQGWIQASRPDQVLPSLILYCPSDNYILCVLFDDTEYVAGLQIAFPVSKFTEALYDWEVQGYSSWSPGDGDSYWATHQYFVDEEFLATSAEEREASRDSSKTLQAGGVWVSGIDGELVKVTSDTDGILDSGFTRQACIPLMGVHYYRNMTSDLECQDDTIFPWFPLTDIQGELIASGLMAVGQMEEEDGDWFERPNELAVQVIVPRGPQCLYDLASSPGVVTIHIYYINSPWTFFCL